MQPLQALLLLAALPWAAGVHPSDGPDADVRIRIADERVTFTVLVNLAYADEVVDVPREDEMSVHRVEAPFLIEALQEHFAGALQVAIDGIAVAPVLREGEVEEPDLSLLVLFPNTGTRGLIRVRLVFDYPAKTPPAKVSMVWGSFPPDLAVEPDRERAGPVMVVAQLTARGTTRRVEFSKDEPEQVWHDLGDEVAARFLEVPQPYAPPKWTVPALSLALLGGGMVLGVGSLFRSRVRKGLLWGAALLGIAAWPVRGYFPVTVADPFAGGFELPDQQRAAAIFRPLHANVYRAFDYVEEEQVYDALAASVHGDLLDRLYNQIYKSLVMQEEGGAVSRVDAVRMAECVLESAGLHPEKGVPSFHVVARWQVDGSVFHWGHEHHRTNEYAARYEVVQTAAGWRIGDQQVLEQVEVRRWGSGEGK